jgi:Tol biopolymer transport system component
MEMDRALGEARLMVEDIVSSSQSTIASLPVLKGSGSSIPASANLSWSPDGKSLVFEFGRGNADRVIYLASVNGTSLVKLADSAHAPAISADGKCLAYISDEQVFLLDLTVDSAAPVLLADLPPGREISDFRLDKLGWRPQTVNTAFQELIAEQ